MRRSKHHRRTRFHGGGNHKGNVILVDSLKHQYFHYLFKHKDGSPMDAYEIAEELNKIWLDPRFKLVVRFQGLEEVKATPDFTPKELAGNPQQFNKRGFTPP